MFLTVDDDKLLGKIDCEHFLMLDGSTIIDTGNQLEYILSFRIQCSRVEIQFTKSPSLH